MRIRPLIATVAVILGLALSSQAEARSRHERVKVEPIKKSGKVVGLRLKLTLRPQDYGHDRVKIGLAPTGGIAKAGLSGNFRDYASNRKKGFLFHQWKEVTGLKTGQPKEMTLEVLYSKNKKIPIGEKVEVVTAWRSGGRATYYHVWGMKSSISGRVSSFKVPGTKPKAAASSSSSSTGSTTTRTRRKKPKPATATTTTRRKKKPKPASTTTTRRKKPKPATTTTTTRRKKKPKPATTTTTTRRKKPKPKKPKGTASSTRQNLQSASSTRSSPSRARSTRSTSSRSRSTSSRSSSRSRSSSSRARSR